MRINHAIRKVSGPLGMALLALMLVAVIAVAQVATASLSGVVSDATGAVVPGVGVTATHVSTNRDFKTMTDAAGRYTFLSLPVGPYKISATATGFRTLERELELTVGQAANLNLTMQLGTITEVVNVTAEAPVVNATTATVGTLIEERAIFDLPLNGRNFAQLITLTPGVSPVDPSQGGAGPSVQGQRNRDNWYVADGVSVSHVGWSRVAITPPIDSIQEFQVQSVNNDAEFGASSGGYVNVATKAGTDKLHGTAYDYLRNNVLDARNTFQPTVPTFRQNQFGFSLGGPVYIPKVYTPESKTWFFVNYEGYRYRRAASSISQVPTEAQRQGDFAGFSPIYNPFSTRPDPDNPGKLIRDPFQNNRIPSSMIHPTAEYWLREYMPKPNFSLPGTRNNFINTAPSKTDWDTIVWRVDHSLTSRDRVFFRWMQTDSSSGSDLPLAQKLSSGSTDKPRNIVAEWSSIVSPMTLLNVRYGYSRTNREGVTPVVPEFFTFAKFDHPDAYPANLPDRPLAPGMNIAGYASFLGQGYSPEQITSHWGIINFQKILGAHTFKAGFNMMRMESFNGGINPVANFRSPQTSNIAAPSGTGDAMASFMLGVPNDAGRAIGQPFASLFGYVYGVYLQDTFRVSPKLSLSYGLRWDYGTNFKTVQANFGSFDQQAGFSSELSLLDLRNIPGDRAGWLLEGPIDIPGARFQGPNARRGLIDPDWNNFSPRFGIAYSITPRTIIRMGYSMFYNVYAGKWQIAQGSRVTWPVGQWQSTPTLNVTTVDVLIDTPFVGLPNRVDRPDPLPASGYQVNRYFDTPYVHQWNLALERQISDKLVVSATYVGSTGRKLECCGVINQAYEPGPGSYTTRPRPYPEMLLFRTNRNDGHSDYQSLQLKAEQRFSKGMAFLFSYTWSKSTDIACSGYIGAEGCNITQPYNLAADHGPSAWDLRHIANISFVYELPFGRGKTFGIQNLVLNHLAGGWQVSGILNFRSGMPLNPALTFDNPNLGGGTQNRPNLVGDVKAASPDRFQWFNTKAFELPPQYTYGNAGRNIVRGPRGHGEDISLFKNFPLKGEALRLQYRADFFNTFNLTILSNPNTSFGTAQFGQISSAGSGRVIQMALKLLF